MARPERLLDPDESPVAQFAHLLRELRHRAGSPTYREMQAASYVSYSSLSRAAAGWKFPTWATTEAFVTACNDDPVKWKARWEAARVAVKDASRRHTSEANSRSGHERMLADVDEHRRAAEQHVQRIQQVLSDRVVPVNAGELIQPNPDDIQTIGQLRAAVAQLVRGRDVRLISSVMRVQMSVVRLACSWPEQVELAVFLSLVQACGASLAETERWARVWRAAVHERRIQANGFPSPGSIHTPERMREVIEMMVRTTSIKAVADRMKVAESTVGRVLSGAERVETELFIRFIAACDVPKNDIDGWIEARRRVVEKCERRRLIAVTAPQPAVATAQTPQTEARAVPDLIKVPIPGVDLASINTYEELLAAIHMIVSAANLSSLAIERSSAGRLKAPTVTAILDGVVPASGEQFVLLLRACGLRENIDWWVAVWSRVRGSRLGNPPVARRQFASPVRSFFRWVTHGTRQLGTPRWAAEAG